MPFDTAALATLRDAKEVGIRASRPKNRSVIIWIVVVDDAVYVRSVRGMKGLWFVAASSDGAATLEFSAQSVSVRAVKVTDQPTIDAVSQAFLSKYAGSPWAQAMVKPEVLGTTLRLDLVD